MHITTKEEFVSAIRDASAVIDDALQTEDMEFFSDLPVLELSVIGGLVGEHAGKIEPESLQKLMDAVERAMGSQNKQLQNQVATGFLEGLLGRWDEDPTASPAIARLGPKSRAYCIAFEEFHGIFRTLPTLSTRTR